MKNNFQTKAYLQQICKTVADTLSYSLLGFYATGSIAFDDYDPARSDIDVMGVTRDPLTAEQRGKLARALDHNHLPCPAKGLDLYLVTSAIASGPPRKPRFEFAMSTGHTWRLEVEHGEEDSELVLHLAICREAGIPLIGASPKNVFGQAPREWILEELDSILRWHMEKILDPYHDPLGQFSILNACRAWCFAETGEFCSKTAGGEWLLAREPNRTLVEIALRDRFGLSSEPAEAQSIRAFLTEVRSIIRDVNAGQRSRNTPAKPQMIIKDDIAKIKLAEMRKDIRRGSAYTKPWLDLDVEAYHAYREGKTDTLPAPYCDDPADRIMMENVQGKNVLCLAAGGGQQSAIFSLLGASVTVLDLSPEQLESDQKAALHYGYKVTTIQGDMRDLSALPDAFFDRVYQPVSTLFIPNLREVYTGVARVLKPGGLYFADCAVPLLYMAQNKGWNGHGYTLYIAEPYIRGEALDTEDGAMSFTRGRRCSEFHHLLSDIINGLIAEGLMIRGLWENPRPDQGPPLEQLEPGSEEHQEKYLPFGLSVIAEKGNN